MGQVSKLGYVDSKLGAPTSGQQTTRVLYHTIPQNSGSQATYFKSFNGLSLGQSNLTQGKLDSSESMVIKTLTLIDVQSSSGVNIQPYAAGEPFVVSVVVGNQTVVKNLPVSLNNGFSGQYFDRLHGSFNYFNSGNACEIRLLTDIVIPPQTEFYVTVEVGNNSVITPSVCILSGYGKIFSAGASF